MTKIEGQHVRKLRRHNWTETCYECGSPVGMRKPDKEWTTYSGNEKAAWFCKRHRGK